MTDEQIIELIKIARQNGLTSGGTLGHHAGWCDDVADCLEELLETIQRQKDEIERLTEQLKTARVEAVREFADTVIERIIRKKAETSDYWQNDVKRYRAMQGYADIEHEADNFLRGYNEAVDDVLALLDFAEMTEGEQ